MRHALGTMAMVIVGLCAACSSASDSGAVDHASTFTGTWAGNGSIQLAGGCPSSTACGGLSLSTSSSATITSSALNELALDHLCEGEPVPASVRSESTFAISSFTCAPVANANCSTPTVVHIDGGSGTFASGVLMVTATGTFTSCGQTVALMYTFSGSRQ